MWGLPRKLLWTCCWKACGDMLKDFDSNDARTIVLPNTQSARPRATILRSHKVPRGIAGRTTKNYATLALQAWPRPLRGRPRRRPSGPTGRGTPARGNARAGFLPGGPSALLSGETRYCRYQLRSQRPGRAQFPCVFPHSRTPAVVGTNRDPGGPGRGPTSGTHPAEPPGGPRPAQTGARGSGVDPPPRP